MPPLVNVAMLVNEPSLNLDARAAFTIVPAHYGCSTDYMFLGWVMLNQLPKGSRKTASTP